jgi:hypothetical protein
MSGREAPWTLELPAALLHLWPRGRSAAWEQPIDRLCAALGAGSGVYRLRPGLLAVVPVAGDPAIVDTAVSYGRLLRAEAAERGGEGALLVTPGAVTIRRGGAELVADPLLHDLEAEPPALVAGEVHVTARAALNL